MITSGLWRTARPRFPVYVPDGAGRDYYIKYDNAGYWADQFPIKNTRNYSRNTFRNFHSLFHQAAPFKYWGNGLGRETYILQTNGLFHDQKPLYSYKLIDFLRSNDENERSSKNKKKKMFMSVSEKKYKKALKKIEKNLISRLYPYPLYMKKSISLKTYNNINTNNHSSRNINRSLSESLENNQNQSRNQNQNDCNKENTLTTNNDNVNIFNIIKKINNNNKISITNNDRKCNNNIYDFMRKRRNNNISHFTQEHRTFSRNRLEGNFDDNFSGVNNEYNSKSLLNENTKCNGIFEYKNKNQKNTFLYPRSYIKEDNNDERFIDQRSEYNRTMKMKFNFNQKPKYEKLKIKKINIKVL